MPQPILSQHAVLAMWPGDPWRHILILSCYFCLGQPRERKRAEDRKRAQMESKRPRYPKDDPKVSHPEYSRACLLERDRCSCVAVPESYLALLLLTCRMLALRAPQALMEEEAVLRYLQDLTRMSEADLAAHEPPKLDMEDEDGVSLAILDSDKKWKAMSRAERSQYLLVCNTCDTVLPNSNKYGRYLKQSMCFTCGCIYRSVSCATGCAAARKWTQAWTTAPDRLARQLC